MTVRQPAMFNVPVSPLRPGGWTCSKCGDDDPDLVRVDPSRPSLAPDLALGFCACTKARKSRGVLVRERVELIRSARWSREQFAAVKARKTEAKLLARFTRGDLLDDGEMDQVRAIIARDD